MSRNTITQVVKLWEEEHHVTQFFGSTIRHNKLSVATSRGGDGMVFLQGIQVQINKQKDKNPIWQPAHISIPPNKEKDGHFVEGHLKIEAGNLLNQYFFSCNNNETWEVEQLPNSPSPSFRTKSPGKWDDLSTQLWSDIDKLVTYIAYVGKPPK